jgi:hypothetical protein
MTEPIGYINNRFQAFEYALAETGSDRRDRLSCKFDTVARVRPRWVRIIGDRRRPMSLISVGRNPTAVVTR